MHDEFFDIKKGVFKMNKYLVRATGNHRAVNVMVEEYHDGQEVHPYENTLFYTIVSANNKAEVYEAFGRQISLFQKKINFPQMVTGPVFVVGEKLSKPNGDWGYNAWLKTEMKLGGQIQLAN